MNIGTVKPISINEEMRDSYLSYAMSVIVARALPDVRDGLKPVQRRILYAMHDMGLYPDRPSRKSARVVGEVLGKYHPHGDQSVYDAMVRMAQDFAMRYPLVEGQGNFGSIDGDAAAAMRYTEARMTTAGADLLEDLDRDTVDFVGNFDDTMREPEVLPATLPNLLINGSSGIAVGMSTSVPPHNLGEVVDALDFMLQEWEQLDELSVSQLLKFIQGPDFPTGGIVFRRRGKSEQDALLNAYATGRGRVTVRARVHVEQMERNKSRLVITELPYQINKTNLIAKIADLHRDGKIEGLTDLRDESDRNGMRIILETTRTVEAEAVLMDLFRLTPMESTFSIIMIALVDGRPRVLTLKQALRHYLEHRLEVVRRRSEHDLTRAKQRAHVLAGLLVALAHLDDVIDVIRRSRSVETARNNLQRRFRLTDVQAQAVLDMPLRRLASLERQKINDEFEEKQRLIDHLEELLSRPELMRQRVREELHEVRSRYADARRTQIIGGSADDAVMAADLLPDEKTWIMITREGTVARTSSPERAPVPPRPPELPRFLMAANTQDLLYLFTAAGEAVSVPVHQLPRARNLGEGTHWADMSGLTRREHLADALVVPSGREDGFLFLTTLGGTCKRVRLEEMPGATTDPFMVMKVEEDDALGWARLTTGRDQVILVTAGGQAIRFTEDEVRAMGLAAGGVYGVRLEDELDGVVAVALARHGHYLWSIADTGAAKASPVEAYPLQGRYGKGVINIYLPEDAAQVAAAVVGAKEDVLIVTTLLGAARDVRLGDAPIGSRSVKPQPVVAIGPRNGVTGVVRLSEQPAFPDEATGDATQLSLGYER